MSVDDLDDAAVLAALQELTAELREALPADQREAVSSQEEAQLALAAVLDPGNAESMAEGLRVDPGQAIAAGRDLLAAAVQDPETAAPATRLVDNPPAEDQMAVLGPPGADRIRAGRWPGAASWCASGTGRTTRWPGWTCCCTGSGGACRSRRASRRSGVIALTIQSVGNCVQDLIFGEKVHRLSPDTSLIDRGTSLAVGSC
jgi:hypothetical protein